MGARQAYKCMKVDKRDGREYKFCDFYQKGKISPSPSKDARL